MNNNNDYLAWKKKVLTDLPDLITSADIASIISSNVKFVNMAIENHRIRSVLYFGKRVVAKQWLEDYLDTLQELYDPIHDHIVFPDELTVQDMGHILGQHPDTVRNLFRGRLRYKKVVSHIWLKRLSCSNI